MSTCMYLSLFPGDIEGVALTQAKPNTPQGEDFVKLDLTTFHRDASADPRHSV
jgi:hypothetical protein